MDGGGGLKFDFLVHFVGKISARRSQHLEYTSRKHSSTSEPYDLEQLFSVWILIFYYSTSKQFRPPLNVHRSFDRSFRTFGFLAIKRSVNCEYKRQPDFYLQNSHSKKHFFQLNVEWEFSKEQKRMQWMEHEWKFHWTGIVVYWWNSRTQWKLQISLIFSFSEISDNEQWYKELHDTLRRRFLP